MDQQTSSSLLKYRVLVFLVKKSGEKLGEAANNTRKVLIITGICDILHKQMNFTWFISMMYALIRNDHKKKNVHVYVK